MPVGLYMDQHVHYGITRQLRLRGVDVLTAQEDGRGLSSDAELLLRATALGRLIVTKDKPFRVLAEEWQRRGTPFGGLVFVKARLSFRQILSDLQIIAEASDPSDWASTVQRLPL